MKSSDPIPVSELTFEQALEELETLTQQMSSGALTLKDSVEGYQRGVELVSRCRRELDAARATIERLEGQTLKPLTPDVLSEVGEKDDDAIPF